MKKVFKWAGLIGMIMQGVAWSQPTHASDVDLGIGVQLSQNRIITGDLVKMRLTVKNFSNDDSSGTQLQLGIQNNAIIGIQNNQPQFCDNTATQLQCQLPSGLAAGAEFQVNLRFQLEQTTDLQPLLLMAQVTGNENDPNGANNQISQSFTVHPIPTPEEYANNLLTNMPENRRARFLRAARVLAAYCAGESIHTRLDGLCDDILQQAELGDFEMLTRVLNWMRPRKSIHQAKSANQLASAQISQINQRLAQLRAGVTGISFNDLYLNDGDEQLSVAALAYLSEEEKQSGDWRSPWGFFINGNIQEGDFKYRDELTDRFDFDAHSITMGWDYRFNAQWVMGFGLGYNAFDSQSGPDLTLRTEGFSGNLYAMWSPTDHWYVDMKYSHARPDIDQLRVENFLFLDEQVSVRATGNSDVEQNTFAISTGYQWAHNAWLFAPFISYEYARAEIDAFTEQGAGGFNMTYQNQSFTTQRLMAGFNLSRSISLSESVLIPQLSYHHSFEDQSHRLSSMRLIGMPVDELFQVDTDFADNNYGQLGLGLTWVKGNGRMFYLKYTQHIASEGLNLQGIQLGMRLEF